MAGVAHIYTLHLQEDGCLDECDSKRLGWRYLLGGSRAWSDMRRLEAPGQGGSNTRLGQQAARFLLGSLSLLLVLPGSCTVLHCPMYCPIQSCTLYSCTACTVGCGKCGVFQCRKTSQLVAPDVSPPCPLPCPQPCSLLSLVQDTWKTGRPDPPPPTPPPPLPRPPPAPCQTCHPQGTPARSSPSPPAGRGSA